jgi:hypothetical protein
MFCVAALDRVGLVAHGQLLGREFTNGLEHAQPAG